MFPMFMTPLVGVTAVTVGANVLLVVPVYC
jgi:hypothetical protein